MLLGEGARPLTTDHVLIDNVANYRKGPMYSRLELLMEIMDYPLPVRKSA